MLKGSSGEVVVDGDSWVCKKCGWTYPNPHPSAKHRRNHRKQCGKVKGFENKAPPRHDAGSSDNVSSDDEDHHHRGTGLADSVNPQQQQQQEPSATEESKTGVTVQPEIQEHSIPSTLPVTGSADNSLRNERSTETGEDMKKASFDPRKEPSDLIQEEPISNAEEITPEAQNEPESGGSLSSTTEITPETQNEPESGASLSSTKLREADDFKQQDRKQVNKPSPLSAVEDEEQLKAGLVPAAGLSPPVQDEAAPSSDPPKVPVASSHPDSWEQLLDAQLSTPQQIVPDSSSSTNNGHLSSTAFPQATEIEPDAPVNGNPFVATSQPSEILNGISDAPIRNVETPEASLVPVAKESQDKKDHNPFFQNELVGAGAPAVADKGEASTSWEKEKGPEGDDIKPHIALKALFDEDPRPRPQLAVDNDEQEALVQSTRRNSNVLQKVIDTVRNSPAKFSSTAPTTNRDGGQPRNRSKSRWSSFICCSQVR